MVLSRKNQAATYCGEILPPPIYVPEVIAARKVEKLPNRHS